jgi:hypothetical protein
MIRRSVRVGEWVVGFVPKGIRRGHVAWAGQIAEVVPLGDYETGGRNEDSVLIEG